MESNHPAAVLTARSNHLSYIATLFMNRGGDQPPMAKIGLAPMKPFGGGFTVRCRCYWTTLPNYALLRYRAKPTVK